MSIFNKDKNKLILISVGIILFIVVVVLFCCNFSADQKSENDAKNEQIVVSIGDMSVTESELRFFSTVLMIEEEETVKKLYNSSDISAKDELKKYTLDFAKEYMIRVLEAESSGITLTESEKETVNKQIVDDYNAVMKLEKTEMSEDEFYNYYYGISKEEYTEFWQNWYLIDKHTKICEEKADVSEESQRMAFEEYYNFLFTYHVSVIPFVIDNTNTAEIQKAKAENVLARLQNGEEFESLLKEFCEEDNLLSLGGETKFYPANKDKYAEVYDWLRVNPVGNSGIVESNYAIYVIRLDDISDFDTLLDSENMLKWTRSFVANKELEDVLKSDKYELKLNESVYNAIDLGDIVDKAYEYWGNIWENEK